MQWMCKHQPPNPRTLSPLMNQVAQSSATSATSAGFSARPANNLSTTLPHTYWHPVNSLALGTIRSVAQHMHAFEMRCQNKLEKRLELNDEVITGGRMQDYAVCTLCSSGLCFALHADRDMQEDVRSSRKIEGESWRLEGRFTPMRTREVVAKRCSLGLSALICLCPMGRDCVGLGT